MQLVAFIILQYSKDLYVEEHMKPTIFCCNTIFCVFKELQLTADMFSLGCPLHNVSKQSTGTKMIILYKDEGTFRSVGYIS